MKHTGKRWLCVAFIAGILTTSVSATDWGFMVWSWCQSKRLVERIACRHLHNMMLISWEMQRKKRYI